MDVFRADTNGGAPLLVPRVPRDVQEFAPHLGSLFFRRCWRWWCYSSDRGLHVWRRAGSGEGLDAQKTIETIDSLF